MTSSQKELVEELSKSKLEISKLKSALNELDKEKESWYEKKENYSKKIKDFIQKIRDNKAKRDSLTQEVKQHKHRRDDTNKHIPQEFDELKSLRKSKTSIAKSLDLHDSPSKILHTIEKLEFKIETEALSFNKEQSVMKKIKELKKLYSDSSEILDIDKKIRNTLESVKKGKTGANELHRLIQEKAKQSQVLHEGILKMSAEIDKLKVDEENAFKKFVEFKQKFNETNAQLKEKLGSMKAVKEQLDKIFADKKERKRAEQELFLKTKEEEVNQKIKLGKKLTTEDLLVFQKLEK